MCDLGAKCDLDEQICSAMWWTMSFSVARLSFGDPSLHDMSIRFSNEAERLKSTRARYLSEPARCRPKVEFHWDHAAAAHDSLDAQV